MAYDWISFTTDYGLDDGFVAACTGVIGRVCPAARVLHATHTLPPPHVRRRAGGPAPTVPDPPGSAPLAPAGGWRAQTPGGAPAARAPGRARRRADGPLPAGVGALGGGGPPPAG